MRGTHPPANSRKSTTGSSPRMRGTPLRDVALLGMLGIIPAYAGNTYWWFAYSQAAGDHPRVCGEHFLVPSIGFTGEGSSPRMRGTPAKTVSEYGLVGIIPAYAGNTCSASIKSPSTRDHPRVCGEHPHMYATLHISEGSSPRMRGTHDDNTNQQEGRGIIPAYAGNTMGRMVCRLRPGDHPRVCGEHPADCRRAPTPSGSSPRMRGTH